MSDDTIQSNATAFTAADPSKENALHFSARDWLTKIRTKEISSREALEFYIDRVQQFNGQLNAVVATDFKSARERADEADRSLKAGKTLGPLHGLPMTIKDTYEVAGMPATSGAPQLSNHYPKRNAVVVQKLLDAGAVIFGKTNVPLFGSDLQSYNKVYGTTNNPWDLSRSPGGSSGGAAAALAAGLTPIEMGSDIGGSIRSPAHYCGIFGHKSSHGTISLRGHIPGPPGSLSEPDLAVAGPLAKTAADLELLYDITAGAGPSEAIAWHLTPPPTKLESLKGCKILVWLDDPLCVIDNSIKRIYERSIDKLTEAGAIVDYGSPLNKDLTEFYVLYLNLMGSVMSGGHRKMERRVLNLASPALKKLSSRSRFNLPPLFENYIKGVTQGHVDWLKTNEKRLKLLDKIRSVFDEYTVILMPVTPTTAIKHQHKPELPLRKIWVNNREKNYTENLMWISPATALGLPATSAPVGITQMGLPVNIQIMGGPYQDKTTIRFAELLSQLLSQNITPPGYGY